MIIFLNPSIYFGFHLMESIVRYNSASKLQTYFYLEEIFSTFFAFDIMPTISPESLFSSTFIES
jgi:hypothetical protein